MENKQLLNDLKQKISDFHANPVIKNTGRVTSIKDGIVLLSGLDQAMMMERIYCSEKNLYAVVLNLLENEVGAAVIGDFTQINEGDIFETTSEILAVDVNENLIGKVLDGMGNVIDGTKADLKNSKKMLLEKIAPGVIERSPVNEPMQTGILAIDATTPVGRGQRQLVIGDRGTGKTAIAIDTIINQAKEEKPVICIYCAIAQKNSKVAAITEILNAKNAFEYTIVVNASASASVTEQFLSPYTATAIGEYFLEQGKDVLIIYDDLTKHAWAYRQISLVLRRPPGREAYPGDIFYLHSRLLERSCKMNETNGSGSITSLPIIETQFGDVSAYIPTNVISITDGQIFLDTEIFNSNIRPAVDVRNSVSRVGGDAQKKPMKKAASKLRLEIATFKELEVFAQFGGSDVDQDTKNKIERGIRITELLKQNQYLPLPVASQIAILTALNLGLFDKTEIEDISSVKQELVKFTENIKDLDQVEEKTKEFFNLLTNNS